MMKIMVRFSLVLALMYGSPSVWAVENPFTWHTFTAWFKSDEKMEPIRFDEVYPTPFYDQVWFKWGSIVLVSVAAATATVMTGGATAVPGASYVGSVVGGMMGTTWTGGLAALGGGSLAAGGLGMAGGAVVVATVTDVGLAAALESVTPEDHMQGYGFNKRLTIPLPRWGRGSREVVEIMDRIIELEEDYKNGNIEMINYHLQVRENMQEALLQAATSSSKYDLINAAVMAYDLERFKDAEKFLAQAERLFAKNSSFLYYMRTILALTYGDIEEALANIDKAIEAEPDALEPYLIKTKILFDIERFQEALTTAESGLANYDDENFQLNYMAGQSAEKAGDLKKALAYFKKALSNTTFNPVEAECKIRIASIYKKLGDTEKARSWREDALGEIEGKKYGVFRKKIMEQYDR